MSVAGNATGMLQQFWGKLESAFDTVSAEAATDAMDLISLEIEPTLDFSQVVSHVGTGSLQEEVEEKRGGTWTATSYVRPGALGVEPDIGALIEAAFGAKTIVGGTSVQYDLSDTVCPSLQLVRYAGANLYQIANGSWVETFETDITGADEPKLTISGGFASYGYVYVGGTVAGVEPAAETDIVMSANHAQLAGVNALVKFGSEDNGGAGYRVTAVDFTTETITISPGLANPLVGGEAMAPVVVSQTLAGATQGGIACGLSIDATAIGLISGKMTLATGIKPLDREASSNRATGLVRVPREVTGELETYFLTENTQYLGGSWNGTLRALIQRAGPDTAGSRMKINTPKSRIEVTPIEIPEAEEVTTTMAFRARQNAAAADELTLLFD